ncbi:MAG: hypothetical protein PHT78_11885 [Desulfitobacteriaceae bacterium]|nr:hypothetical protein [Desulfitobacteriaceae bacterium]
MEKIISEIESEMLKEAKECAATLTVYSPSPPPFSELFVPGCLLSPRAGRRLIQMTSAKISPPYLGRGY